MPDLVAYKDTLLRAITDLWIDCSIVESDSLEAVLLSWRDKRA
jgi:hypothetical protein